MSCKEIGPRGAHSDRKYCQSWEQAYLIDKKEVGGKRNTSEEDGLVLSFYEVGVLWDREFPGKGITRK